MKLFLACPLFDLKSMVHEHHYFYSLCLVPSD